MAEDFLRRWSRLKHERAAEAPPDPAGKQPVEMPPEPAPLPPVEKLTPESDFSPFMQPKVGEALRRVALKKLFTDPHFNTPDPFEPYSIDLTGEDPIPEEMLKTLNHAKRLLFDEKQQTAEAQAETQASPQPQAEKTETDVAGKQDA